MRAILRGAILGALLVATAAPAWAQDEIVVTGLRALDRDEDDDELKGLTFAPPAPVQMLRRTADFAVQQVIVTSDSIDDAEAKAEIFAMTRKAIALAPGAGTLLATGELVVEPLTEGNYKELEIEDDRVKFLVKVPLAPGIDAKAALARIDKFIKAVPPVGRAEMKAYSELTLSVVDPEQYRGAIIDLIAKDTNATSARFGAGYGVEVTGLDRSVQWQRAGLTEVRLFLPANTTVRPRN